MIARASLVVGARPDGSSRCTEIRSDPPLTLRETATGVHLVASGAGPVGGDDLALSVRVDAGAALDLRSVAASMVHPGPTGLPSYLAVDVELGTGASLRWTPQPSILVNGCDHHVTTHVTLGGGATLVWREETVLGRHHEPSGSVLQRLRVDGPSGPILRTDQALGPRWPGSLGPGGVGAAAAVGTVVLVGGDEVGHVLAGTLPIVDGVRWAASPLGGRVGAEASAALVTAVALRAGALTDALDRLDAGVRRIG